jgi:hypothetical protein
MALVFDVCFEYVLNSRSVYRRYRVASPIAEFQAEMRTVLSKPFPTR